MTFLHTFLPLTFVHLVTVFVLALKWVVGFPTLLPPPLRALTITGVSATRTGATIAATAFGLPTAKPGSTARGVAPAFTVVVVAPGLVVVVVVVPPVTVVVGVAVDDDPPGGTVPFAEAWENGAENVAKVLDVVVVEVDVVDVDEVVDPPGKLVVEVLDVVLVEVGATVGVVVLVEVVGAVVLEVVVVA